MTRRSCLCFLLVLTLLAGVLPAASAESAALTDEQANTAELVYVTHSAKDSEIMAAIAEMKAMDNVLAEGEEPAVIRLAGK